MARNQDTDSTSMARSIKVDDAVSVIIPTYNRAHLIARALGSVLAAVEPRDEIIVVDDGSTDETRDVVRVYGDRIRYILTENGGAGAARNRGVEASRRPLVAFLDSDDEWMPDKLYLQRRALRACADAVMCFTDLRAWRRDGAAVHNLLAHWQRQGTVGIPGVQWKWEEVLEKAFRFSELAPLPVGRSDFDVFIGDMSFLQMRAFQISAQTVMVDRQKAEGAFWFPEDLPTCEDWECFGRLAGVGPTVYLDCETAWFRVHSGPRLTDADTLVNAETGIRVLNRVWGKDAEFLNRHGAEYEMLLRGCRLMKAQRLLRKGAVHSAKEELRGLTDVPRSYRALTWFPGWAVRGILGIRRVCLKWSSRSDGD